jgi:hypothetical protein
LPEPIIIRETITVPAPAAPVAQQAAMTTQAMTQPVTAISVAPEANLAWVQAFQETQRQTAEAHAAYQRAMADSHMAFLKTAESSFSGLGAMLGGTASAQPIAAPALAIAPPVQYAAAPQVQTVATIPAAVIPQAVATPAPVPTPVAAPVVQAAPAVVKPAAAPALDLQALMMTIVAEKTGYPEEMLGAEPAGSETG